MMLRSSKLTRHPHAPTQEKSDETLSLAASNLFFQSNEILKDVHPCRKKNDNHSSTTDSKYDEDQKYWHWLQSIEEYNNVVEDGPEVSSSMISATKIF